MELETNIKVYDEKSLPSKQSLFSSQRWGLYQHGVKDSQARLISDFREVPEGETVRLNLGTANHEVFDDISDLLGGQIEKKKLDVKAIGTVLSVDEHGDSGFLKLVKEGLVDLYSPGIMNESHYQTYGRKLWIEEQHRYYNQPGWGQYVIDMLFISICIHSFDNMISALDLKPVKDIDNEKIVKLTNTQISSIYKKMSEESRIEPSFALRTIDMIKSYL